jgi:hypothetical protein
MRSARLSLAAVPAIVWLMAGFIATAAAVPCEGQSLTCPEAFSPPGTPAPLAADPTASEALELDARPSPGPKRTPKPRPTPKPKATPAPTPKPALAPAPQPTAAPIVKPAPRATPKPSAAASIVPAAGVTLGGPLEGTGGVGPADPLGAAGMIIALVTAAGGGVLLVVAMRRMRSEAPEGSTTLATPGIIEAETPSPPLTVRPAASSEPTEAHLPRWLRPSVRACRSESGRDAATSRERVAPLAFAAPADEGVERLVVRYDLVALLDRPDEALGMRQGELDSGDEVEVLEREATWAHVRTPTDATGWIPAMTLTSSDAFAEELETGMRSAASIDADSGRDDPPALETLLAIAAQRRARVSGESPVAPDELRDPPTRTRPERPRKIRKAKRTAGLDRW